MASSIFHAETLWTLLESACTAKDHPWRTPGLSTVGPQGPQSRHLVLRGVDPARGVLRFYTDSRSAKVRDIQSDNRVSVLFWNPQGNEQLRLWGTARLVLSPDQLAAHWAGVPVYARKEYSSRIAPGLALKAQGTLLESQSEPSAEAHTELERVADAEAHFSVLEVQARGMDFLKLSRAGHSRQVFRLGDDGLWESEPVQA